MDFYIIFIRLIVFDQHYQHHRQLLVLCLKNISNKLENTIKPLMNLKFNANIAEPYTDKALNDYVI